MQVSQPQAFSGVVLYTKTDFFLFMFLIDVFTPVPGVWKFVKNHYKPKYKNHCTGVFDSSNEAPGRTDCNAKNLNSVRCTIAEKIKNKQPKI